MTDNSSVEDGDLKRKLVVRRGFAGALIAMLLGALASSTISVSPRSRSGFGPTYTSPVPVGKKEITQPVTPAESPAPVASPAAIEPPQAPVPCRRRGTDRGTTLPAPVTETLPGRVAAQPMLPGCRTTIACGGRPSRSAAAAAEEHHLRRRPANPRRAWRAADAGTPAGARHRARAAGAAAAVLGYAVQAACSPTRSMPRSCVRSCCSTAFHRRSKPGCSLGRSRTAPRPKRRARS